MHTTVPTDTKTPDVSIVIPAYNEAQRLPATLAAWRRFLTPRAFNWEVLVVDDGSTDKTATVVEVVSAQEPRVHLLRRPRNMGKGAAVRAGMRAARGAVIFAVDADCNVAPANVPAFLEAIEGGAGVVIGTRSARQYAATERSPTRVLAGLLIQVLRRALLLPRLRDTQCGFKAFTHQMARAVFARTVVNGFAFDIEALFIARRLGARIVERPVEVVYRPGSTYSLQKHLLPFVREIIATKRRDLRGAYRLDTGRP